LQGARNICEPTATFRPKPSTGLHPAFGIISSGDDAAGLAIANTFRSDQAVLAQGVRNANDGLSQLQIADSGISNNFETARPRSYAGHPSASGAFTGPLGAEW